MKAFPWRHLSRRGEGTSPPFRLFLGGRVRTRNGIVSSASPHPQPPARWRAQPHPAPPPSPPRRTAPAPSAPHHASCGPLRDSTATLTAAGALSNCPDRG